MAYKENRVPNIIMEHVKISNRNFSGERYQRGGERSVRVNIEDPDIAQKLSDDGWPVHIRMPKEDGDKPYMYIPAAIKYKTLPPTIVVVSSKKYEVYDESRLAEIDGFNIRDVDVELRPRYWVDDDGNEKIKAYVKAMHVYIEDDDPFAYKLSRFDEDNDE